MLEIHSTISICHSGWKCSHFGIACVRAHPHTLQRKTKLNLLHAQDANYIQKTSLFSKNWFLFYSGADYFNYKKFESLNWECNCLNLQFIWNKVAQTKYKFILLHRGNFFLNLTKKKIVTLQMLQTDWAEICTSTKPKCDAHDAGNERSGCNFIWRQESLHQPTQLPRSLTHYQKVLLPLGVRKTSSSIQSFL